MNSEVRLDEQLLERRKRKIAIIALCIVALFIVFLAVNFAGKFQDTANERSTIDHNLDMMGTRFFLTEAAKP